MSESLHQHIEGQGPSFRAMNRSHSFSCLIVIIETESFRYFASHSFSKRQNKNNIRYSQGIWPWENEIKIKTLEHWTWKGADVPDVVVDVAVLMMISWRISHLFSQMIYSFLIPPSSFRKKAIPAAGACGGIGQSIKFIDEARWKQACNGNKCPWQRGSVNQTAWNNSLRLAYALDYL